MALGEQAEPEILGDVGVLVFVHEDVAEPFLVLRQHLRIALEDRQVVEQQVAEIDGVEVRKPLLIGLVKRRRAAVGETARLVGRHLLRAPPLVLPALDDGRKLARGPVLRVHIRVRQHLFEEPFLVVRVEDREGGPEVRQLGMAAQYAQAERVESAEPEAGAQLADQRVHPLAHFVRRPVGEGDRQNLAGPGAFLRQQQREPRRQHPRLAGARAGKHQQRPVQRLDRLALRGVQPGEPGGFGGRRGGQGIVHSFRL